MSESIVPSAPPSTPERGSPDRASPAPADDPAPAADPPREKPKLTAEDFFPDAHLPPIAAVGPALPFLREIQRMPFLRQLPLKERTTMLYILLRVLLSFAELAAAFAHEKGVDAAAVRAQLVAELGPTRTLARLVLLVHSNMPSRAALAAAHGVDDLRMYATRVLNALQRLSFIPVTAGFFAALNAREDMRISAAIFFSTEELDADDELRARTARAWNAFLAPADWALVPVAPGTANKRAKWVPRADAPSAF